MSFPSLLSFTVGMLFSPRCELQNEAQKLNFTFIRPWNLPAVSCLWANSLKSLFSKTFHENHLLKESLCLAIHDVSVYMTVLLQAIVVLNEWECHCCFLSNVQSCSRQLVTVDLNLTSAEFIQFYFMYGCMIAPSNRDQGVLLEFSVNAGISWNLLTEIFYDQYSKPEWVSLLELWYSWFEPFLQFPDRPCAPCILYSSACVQRISLQM